MLKLLPKIYNRYSHKIDMIFFALVALVMCFFCYKFGRMAEEATWANLEPRCIVTSEANDMRKISCFDVKLINEKWINGSFF